MSLITAGVGEITIDNCGYWCYIGPVSYEGFLSMRSEAYQRSLDFYASRVEESQLTPRIRMGLRLYAHCAVPTLKEAARVVGVSHVHLLNMAKSPAGIEFMETAHSMIANTALSTNALIEKLSRRAIEVIGVTMEDASSEALRLKAAIDLADRGPETSKIHKHQVESFTLGSDDAREIASALVAAATVRQTNANLVHENFDKVNIDEVESSTTEVIPSPSLRLEP